MTNLMEEIKKKIEIDIGSKKNDWFLFQSCFPKVCVTRIFFSQKNNDKKKEKMKQKKVNLYR